MNIELSIQEQSLILDSIFARVKQIDKLIETFEDPRLIEMYLSDRDTLIELQTKILNRYEAKTI